MAGTSIGLAKAWITRRAAQAAQKRRNQLSARRAEYRRVVATAITAGELEVLLDVMVDAEMPRPARVA